MVCGGDAAGKTDIGGCRGDSGGPYVCEKNGKWELQGVTSWGKNGCYSALTVFARVHYYKEWIQMKVRRINHD